MAAVIESMTKIRYRKWTIRIWRDENPKVPKPNYDNSDILQAIRKVKPQHLGLLCTVIESMPRINAFEILDGKGMGLVVYPEWP